MSGFVEPVGDWTEQYFVPWSQVHPNSSGSQIGNVHLVRAVDPGHYSIPHGLRTPRRKGDVLCEPKKRGWFAREPRPDEVTERRCPRCESYAEKAEITWPTDKETQR